MDEELKKRHTDCVYFLASPLTCKKGAECEYRHSEIARLNPRDCWYWLAGNCLNPSCAFRHPPLDTHTEVSSESAPPQSQCSAPVNKFNVPCYYYFNLGFCNKGDKCSFLHGPCEDGTPAWKSSMTTSAATVAPHLENKTIAVSDAGSAPIEILPNPSEAACERAKELHINPKPDVHLSARKTIKDQSVSPHMSASECEEAAAVRSDTLQLSPRGLIQSRSRVCTDQSSEEELVDGHMEREDWLESSPGFDVLVDDDRSENLGYEVAPGFVVHVDRDGRELNGHFSGYDYEDTIDDDLAYPDARIRYEQERGDSSDRFDNGQRFDYIRNVQGHSRETMLAPVLPRKRKFLPMGTDDQRGVDLRNHLRKRRLVDGRFSRRSNSSLVDRSRERTRKHGTPRLLGRLNSEVHKNGNLPRSNRPRQRYMDMERRQSRQKFLSSEVSRKPVSRKKRSTEEPSNLFTGPKTLAELREEKRKATENNGNGRMGNSSRTTLEEFQGPKPLSEILKDKKKLGSVIETNNDSS